MPFSQAYTRFYIEASFPFRMSGNGISYTRLLQPYYSTLLQVVFSRIMVLTFVNFERLKGGPFSYLVLSPVPRSTPPRPPSPHLSSRMDLCRCLDSDVCPVVCNDCLCCQVLSEVGLQEKRQVLRWRGRLCYLQQLAAGQVNVRLFRPPRRSSERCGTCSRSPRLDVALPKDDIYLRCISCLVWFSAFLR